MTPKAIEERADAAHTTPFDSRAWNPIRQPVIPILVLAGIFDGISGNPIHSILLFGTAAALGRDLVLRRRGVQTDPEAAPLLDTSSRGPGVAVIVAALAFAIVVGTFGRYSWPATAAIIVPGTGALAIAWRGPLRDHLAPERIPPVGIVAWASVFVALALWELTSLLLQPSLTTDSYAHPTLSVLTDPALATHPGRSIALFAWLALGGFLILR